MGPDSKSAAKSILLAVTDLKADGDTVVFTLTAGNADFPFLASDYHMPIMPATDGKSNGNRASAPAPTTRQVRAGRERMMKRNPNFYKDTWFDEIEMIAIADVAARTNALTAGEVHYIDRCDLKTLDLLKATPGVKITEVTGYGHYIFLMNVTGRRSTTPTCAGAQICHRPPGNRGQGVLRPRHGRQRQSDRADNQVCHRSAAAA